MTFVAVTDKDYGPPLVDAYYWVVVDHGDGAQPAEWCSGAFWLIGTDQPVDYSDIEGFWPVPIREPAKLTGE
jgi:hypothetical protein